MENLDHILIFKTNINCESDEHLLRTLLDDNPDIQSWSIDMEDKDCVLRIISPKVSYQQIISLINHHGFECYELI